MCRTDVAQYYPSVSLPILEKLLSDNSCAPSAVRRIVQVFEYWQRVEGLSGLPIGVEASAALGNVYLASVDHAISEAGGEHFRFADDLLIFAETRSIGDALLNIFDGKLRVLGLERSVQKTEWFDDLEKAVSSLKKPWLSSLGSTLKREPVLIGRRNLLFAFDGLFRGDVSQTDPSEFHYIVRALKHLNDDYGCVLLAQNAALMNVDPRLSADYLMIGLRAGPANRSRLIEACMTQLSQIGGEYFNGLRLHLLRAMALTKCGELEGNEFLKFAIDDTHPWPVRNFAWHAYAQSAARKDSLVMEAAQEEGEPNVRRAIIATLKTSEGGRRTRRKFLRHAARKFPESRFIVEWVRLAA
jgi:Reverse transcriptase (RNA-dependent DNA polymerase)